MVFVVGCGPKAIPPEAALDTPQHHAANGDKLLVAGRIEPALTEYLRAQKLDPKYAPAHIGLGLCYGFQGKYAQGIESMKTGRRYAKSTDDELSALVGFIRLYTLGSNRISKDWLGQAKIAFTKARGLSAERPEPYYYMGLAYKEAHAYQQAAGLFKTVLDLDTGYVDKADRQLALLQRIERAALGSAAGKRIALIDKITRGDAASLLVEELQIDALFGGQGVSTADSDFVSPDDRFATHTTIDAPPAKDIADHPMKADIEEVISLGIKGLQPFPDHTFRPEQVLTRAELAMVLEDLLVKITGQGNLATRFIGSSSPFPDVRNDLPFFNAVMTCTTRGILKANNLETGAFEPMGTVPGADAVLAIRTLKSQL